MTADLILGAPLEGWAAPLDETGDPVFAERMLGDGIAIDPLVGELRAPCDGEVIGLHAAHHAVTLKAANGAEILMHIGLETVALAGEGFTASVALGDRVSTGALLLSFDLDRVARGAKSLVSPLVVVNGETVTIRDAVVGRVVRFGEPIMTLRGAAAASREPLTGSGLDVRRTVRVALAHGLHARPAALLSRSVAPFSADVWVALGGRRASARSPVSLMTLGVRHGDEIVLTASGPDADAALNAAAALVATAQHAPAPAVAIAPAPPSSPPLAPAGRSQKLWQGVAAASGLAIGTAVRLIEAEVALPPHSGSAADEHAGLDAALAAARDALAGRLTATSPHGRDIVEAHLAFLEDPELAAGAHAGIDDSRSAGAAWRSAIEGYVTQLRATGDALMIERAADLADLERQVLMQLSGDKTSPIALPDNAILLADDILPSQLMELDAARIAGLAIAAGGRPRTSRSWPRRWTFRRSWRSVLACSACRTARSLSSTATPVGSRSGRTQVRSPPHRPGSPNAGSGARAPWPPPAGSAAPPTACGSRCFANLGAVDGSRGSGEATAQRAAACCAPSSCSWTATALPDEDEQHAAYQAIADALVGRPLIIRTLDVGRRQAGVLPARCRTRRTRRSACAGVRVGLAWPELLRTQLRAILRVRPAGQARVLLPMMASVSELRAVRAIVGELAAELGAPAPELGVMVETPAAAVTADLLAAEADFLSIGTNDLTQYALAMDRTNPQLAADVDALHPAVLRLIRDTTAGARARKVGQSPVCGGLASDLAAAPILIGLGVDRAVRQRRRSCPSSRPRSGR